MPKGALQIASVMEGEPPANLAELFTRVSTCEMEFRMIGVPRPIRDELRQLKAEVQERYFKDLLADQKATRDQAHADLIHSAHQVDENIELPAGAQPTREVTPDVQALLDRYTDIHQRALDAVRSEQVGEGRVFLRAISGVAGVMLELLGTQVRAAKQRRLTRKLGREYLKRLGPLAVKTQFTPEEEERLRAIAAEFDAKALTAGLPRPPGGHLSERTERMIARLREKNAG